MGTITLALGAVVIALSVYGLFFILKEVKDNTVEKGKKSIMEEADDDIVEEFQTFEAWEQSQIFYASDTLEEFEEMVEMWRPQD